MKEILLVASLLLAGAARAADVDVSIQIGQPGFYGRIDIGSTARPPVVLREPIWVKRRIAHVDPVYMRIPPGHQKHWDKHCARYDACNVPVYFVREDWYQERYVRSQEENDQGEDRGKGKHGKGRGKDQDRD